MTFLQSIEFQGDHEQFVAMIDRYKELMGSETTAKRAWLLEDRERPGTFVELVEFDSYEAAMANSEHPGTQKWAEEATAILGSAVFRNFELVQTFEM